MTTHSKSTPHFYDHEQAMMRFDCDKNIFNLSSLKEFERSLVSYEFAIKFVCEGVERYTVNNKSYTITPGSYLLMNGEKQGHVSIDSAKTVKGICLSVSNEVIADIIATIQAPDTPFSDLKLSDFFYTEHFLENQYQAQHTHLGRNLQEISTQIQQNVFTSDQINQELFYKLAESLVADQVEVFKQLQSIPTVKAETKRDLCRRVLKGKEFIDSNFTDALTIEQIARIAGMSEYHFFRLFKQIIGMTPYQYILSNRLKTSAQMLKADYSVSDIAIAMGFSDIYSFSKTFKKHFGLSPTLYASARI
ncbi:MAG: AraC family transcriptional regulator [Fluviicola sp.]|jgi:AraC-like DNA-binding protein|uniref:AraC family transcriptional regulator n=1 Tax=Fluviicola sp. TaxID=1917219 RepID=UPI00260FC48E|nr:AraC family transcriptional regulator [Fluviicola sp.]MDF3026188.1 AraC family transcriptional regulator [Fluviicola sp.]